METIKEMEWNEMKWNKWISYNTANREALIKSDGLSSIFNYNKLSNTCIATGLADKCTVQDFEGENFMNFMNQLPFVKVLPSKCLLN